MCRQKNCGCNTPSNPIVCISYDEQNDCGDRSLTASNTEHPIGYEDVTIITPEVNQISAFKEHLEFINSPEPVSGIKKHVVLRIAQTFIDGITGLISGFSGRNLGDGAKVYKGPKTEGQDVIHEFKTIKSSGSVTIYEDDNLIVPAVNEVWLQEQFPDIPVVDYPITGGASVGDGIPMFKGVTGKNISIATISTSNLDIKVKPDGGLSIDSLESGSISDFAFFVNRNYQPTPSTPPNGTRSRPYTTLKDAVYARLGITNASQDTLTLRLNPPANVKNSIILLSSIEDDVDPLINGGIFRLEEGVEYVYTGNKTYYGDLIALYNLLKVPGQPLTKDIYWEIQGEGVMTRQTGFGHIQIQNNPSDGQEHMSFVRVRHEGAGIKFIENKNYSAYTPLTDQSGNPLFNSSRVHGANIPPTTPLFNILGKASKYPWSIEFSGGVTAIQTMSQVGVRVNDSRVYSSDIIKVEISTIYISYVSKLINYVDGDITRPVYFKPYDGRNAYELLNGSSAQLNSISFIADAPSFHNVNSVFRLTNGSVLSIPNNILGTYDLGAVSFIEYSGTGNDININNGNIVSPYSYFIKGDNINTISLVFKNSTINRVLNTDLYQTSITTINTDGTISSVKSIPYLTIPQFWNNNDEAVDLGGLKVGALYRSLTTGSNDAVVKVVV